MGFYIGVALFIGLLSYFGCKLYDYNEKRKQEEEEKENKKLKNDKENNLNE